LVAGLGVPPDVTLERHISAILDVTLQELVPALLPQILRETAARSEEAAPPARSETRGTP
jgi:hypothetical protein